MRLANRWRNHVTLVVAVTINTLGRDGPPSKIRNGRFCLLCPHCNEMFAYVNARNNIAHCFPLQREPQQYQAAADDGLRLPLRRGKTRTLVERTRTLMSEILRPHIAITRSPQIASTIA